MTDKIYKKSIGQKCENFDKLRPKISSKKKY